MTNVATGSDEVLKTDDLGRVRTPGERRQKLLDEFERSGLSGRKFAALAGIKYPTFAAWAQRRRKQLAAGKAPARAVDPVRWLEAVMTQGEPSPRPLKVHLHGGAWIELSNVQQVELAATLVRAMEKAAVAC
jgi:acetyl esterase/lipase